MRIHVRDAGPGIPADQLEMIFESFVQLPQSSATPGRSGVGLGLAISRDLARAMGGDLAAHSELGHGATFTLELPRAGTRVDAAGPDAGEPSTT